MTQAILETPKTFAVFEHEKRREWGLGVLAWETSTKRGYVFENGQLRILVRAFYPLMREVDRPIEEIRALVATLKPELDAARAELGSSAHPARRESSPPMSFEEQLELFRAAFPGGFEDPQWVEQQRGTNAKKRLVAHRDPAIADAQKLLGAEALEARIASQAFRSIQDDIWTLLKRTDLLPSAELALLRTPEPERQRALSLMVMELLHGGGDYGTRFDRFVVTFQQAFGKPAGWQFATALPALVEPSEHVAVRPTAFRAQARWMAPGSSLPKSPNSAGYRRCLAMAKHVATRLTEQNQPPRDLMDVYDFIRITAKPRSKQAAAKK